MSLSPFTEPVYKPDRKKLIANGYLMPYLIDGHNLIGQLPDLSLDDPNDEARLVQKLISFVARQKTRCVVIFDHGLPGGRSKMSTRGVQVIFASQHSSADRVMSERIRQERNPRGWIVVTSDNEVLANARRQHMATLTGADFAPLLERSIAPSRPGDDEAPDVQLSPGEVDAWLRIFGEEE